MTTTQPPKKLWETAATLDPLVERYTVGDDPDNDLQLLPYEVYGTLGHAAGLCRIGVLSPEEFVAVRKTLNDLLFHVLDFKIERRQEDIHTAVEQYLTAKLGDVGAKIHAGRSRNDQVQVDVRLFLKERLLRVHGLACETARSWATFGKKNADALLPGYTHMQRAMPTTVGHWAASHAEALLENARLLKAAYVEADSCPLGSGAGYGASLPLERDYVSQALGFARVQRNTLRVQTSRPRLEAVVLSALSILARDIGVLAEDLCLYSTAEFGFFKLDETFTTGSSIMPQKRNPDVAELTRARAALFPGWLQQALAVGALSSGYHRDYQLTKGPLFDGVRTALEMLEMVERMPRSLAIDTERCKASVTEDLLSTQKALELVEKGVPFREAYRRVADKARSAAAGAKPASKVTLPDYCGAPGNPGFAELASDHHAEAEWSRAEYQKLGTAWRRLLKLDPPATV
ncbi:MAG: argininosuccinate lyase [Elusimicrobia bacterium]|nr:argininosuccinate lyase [Elusimicrobiota bacterium]